MSGILLQSGNYYSYTNPQSNVFTIEDIALSLSNVCRFGGQVDKHYSVAQHSVLVSYAIDPEFALDGLMHDAAEAFLGDCPTPLKMLLPDYKAMEELHERDIFRRFGLQYPMRPEVKVADKALFCAEVRDLKPPSHHWDGYCGESAWTYAVVPWPAQRARNVFLNRYYELTGEPE